MIQFLRTFSDIEYFSINPILDLMQFLAFIGLLLLGMKEYRDQVQEGILTFPKALLLGVIMVLLSFVMVVTYFTIYYNFVDNETTIKGIPSFISAYYDSLFVLFYGLLFAFCVALYVFRGKKTAL